MPHAKTLHIAAFQMQRVQAFANQAIVLAENPIGPFSNPSLEEKALLFKHSTLRDALETAIRVAYAIPFVESRTGTDGGVLSKLPLCYLKILTKPERALHDQIVRERQQMYAHADSRHFRSEIEIRDDSWSHRLDSPDFFSCSTLRQVEMLSEKLRLHFDQEFHRLIDRLENGVY